MKNIEQQLAEFNSNLTNEMLGIIPRAIRDLLMTADSLNGNTMREVVKVKIYGRFGFLGRNQVELEDSCQYMKISSAESFVN